MRHTIYMYLYLHRFGRLGYGMKTWKLFNHLVCKAHNLGFAYWRLMGSV